MTAHEVPVPGFLAVEAEPPNVAERALALYRQLAEFERRADEAQRSAERHVADHQRRSDHTMAVLASQYFEFERLTRRIRPELERSDLTDALRAIDLFARSWRQELEREHVEVLDVTGFVIAGELAESIEVNAPVPLPGATDTRVRETLAPLVRHRGRVIGPAVVNTSVPTSLSPDVSDVLSADDPVRRNEPT